jgi:hypothetical protein
MQVKERRVGTFGDRLKGWTVLFVVALALAESRPLREDVIAYSESRNQLFLIEAVHSCGEMAELRMRKLKGKLLGSIACVCVGICDKKGFPKNLSDTGLGV